MNKTSASATVSGERLDYLIDLTIGRDTKAALRELKSARQLLARCGPYLRHDVGMANGTAMSELDALAEFLKRHTCNPAVKVCAFCSWADAITALRKDAERYLRMKFAAEDGASLFIDILMVTDTDKWDAAIDAALTAAQERQT